MVVNAFVLLKVDSSIWWGQDISLRGSTFLWPISLIKISVYPVRNNARLEFLTGFTLSMSPKDSRPSNFIFISDEHDFRFSEYVQYERVFQSYLLSKLL